MAKTKEASKSNKTNKVKVNKKSTSTKQARNNILQKEIMGIFIVSFAVFMIVVTTKEAQTGIIGRSINLFTRSAFGAGAEVLPYFILAIGVLRLLNIIILNDNNQIAAIIGFFLSYIIYRAVGDPDAYLQISDSSTFKELADASFELGRANLGGGIIGNLITFLLDKLLGKNGIYIILGALTFSLLVLLTNQSIIGLI